MRSINSLVIFITMSAKGSVISALWTVFISYFLFTVIEAVVETIFWGAPFQHVFDYAFLTIYILLSGYVAYACYIYKRIMRGHG